MIGAVHVMRRLAVAGAVTLGAELAAAVLWPAPDQTTFDASATVGPGTDVLRVAALGDSTITAPGVDDPDEIWVRVVARRLSEQLGRTIDLRSFAVGGATTRDVLAGQLGPAVAFAPDLAFVSIGANDVIHGVPMRRMTANLDEIVSTLSAGGARVVCSGVGDLGTIPRLRPPLRQMVSGMGARADRVHARICARYGAIKVEQWGWSRHQFRTRRDVWSADYFHPNAAGHLVWADTCWSALGPVLDGLVVAPPA